MNNSFSKHREAEEFSVRVQCCKVILGNAKPATPVRIVKLMQHEKTTSKSSVDCIVDIMSNNYISY